MAIQNVPVQITAIPVIERLRASKQAADAKDQAAGHAAGRKWAEEKAEYHALERLAWFCASHDSLVGGPPVWTLLDAIDPHNERERWDLLAEVGADKLSREEFDAPLEYYVAFIEGAVEVFKEVRQAWTARRPSSV
jgi:hypothetical protein